MKRGLAAVCFFGMGAALFATEARSQTVTCYLVVLVCDANGQNCKTASVQVSCPTSGSTHARFDRASVPSKRAVREGSRCTFERKGAKGQTIRGTLHGEICDLDSPVR